MDVSAGRASDRASLDFAGRQLDDIPIRQTSGEGEHHAESPIAWPIIFPVITRGHRASSGIWARPFPRGLLARDLT